MCNDQNENPITSSRDLDAYSYNYDTKNNEFKGFAEKFIPADHDT